jgi:hypothetical protein
MIENSPGDPQNFKSKPETSAPVESEPVKKSSIFDVPRRWMNKIRQSHAEASRATVESQRLPLNLVLRTLGQSTSESSAAAYYFNVPASVEQVSPVLRILDELKKGDDLAEESGFVDMPKRSEAAYSLLMSVPDLAPAEVYKLLFKLEGHDWDIESVINDGELVPSESESDAVGEVADALAEGMIGEPSRNKVGEVLSIESQNQTADIKQWLEWAWEQGYEVVWVDGIAKVKVGNVLIDQKKLLEDPAGYLEEAKSQLAKK